MPTHVSTLVHKLSQRLAVPISPKEPGLSGAAGAVSARGPLDGLLSPVWWGGCRVWREPGAAVTVIPRETGARHHEQLFINANPEEK